LGASSTDRLGRWYKSSIFVRLSFDAQYIYNVERHKGGEGEGVSLIYREDRSDKAYE
jgi:hypothetical protein